MDTNASAVILLLYCAKQRPSLLYCREVLIPGSAYDRSGNQPPSSMNGGPFYGRDPFMRATHDQIGFIPQERGAYPAALNLPVPIGMFMSPVPPYQPHHMQAPGKW